jgi:hypothetical protein
VVRVGWEPAGSAWLRWPLLSLKGSLVRFSGWEALPQRPGGRHLAADASDEPSWRRPAHTDRRMGARATRAAPGRS